jgi:ribosomal protein S18 acetylase RimI-like enzyme
MTAPPDAAGIEYGVFASGDADAMAKVLGEAFSRHDPPAAAVGLTAPEFEALVRLYCPKAEAEGLTIVARSADTGELVGALLTEDGASAPPGGMDRLSGKFDPIFDILGQLDDEYRGGRPAGKGERLHLFLLGVDDRVAGRGVARGLVAACLERGAEKGYRVAVTEATNRVSQHVFRKLGFVERARRSYGEHRFGGEAVFASIAGQGGPMLMERSLELGTGRPL